MTDMRSHCSTVVKWWFLTLLGLTLSTGCGDGKLAEKIKSNNQSNLQILSNCYRLYANFNSRSGPPDEETFKDFLKNNEDIERNLKLMGLSRELVDDYFVSDRDNEPFVVLYGNSIAPGSNDPLVLEQTGVDGIRAVALTSKLIEVNKESDYNELLKGKIPKAFRD
jgi:hypothetical protein